MQRAVLAWNGGEKDCALARQELRAAHDCVVVEPLTTIDREHGRNNMPGVGAGLHQRQAEELDPPTNLVSLPHDPSNDEHERVMAWDRRR